MTAASTNSITLSWKILLPVPIKGFEVQRGAGTPEFATLAATAGPQLTYTDAALQPGVVYSYKVRALLDKPGPAAYSEFSPPVQAVAVPGAPVLSCSARTASTNTTQLSWAAVPGAEPATRSNRARFSRASSANTRSLAKPGPPAI